MGINKNLKWALVLSGGGAKGLAHVGVLKALAEKGYPEPSLVVGTSMGAIVGGLYASGCDPDELVRFTLEDFDIAHYLDSSVFTRGGPLRRILQAGQFLGNLAGRPGIDSGNQVEALIGELSGHRTFEECRIPFRCNAVDLITGQEVVFRSGRLARAIRASLSFPIFFEPLVEGDRCLVDGGLADNMPVKIARDEGFRRVLAVDVGAFKTKPVENLDSAAKVMYRSLEVTLNLLYGQIRNRADLTITASNQASPLSFSKKRELVALGEQAVQDNEKALTAFFNGGLGAYLARRRYRGAGD